MSLYRWIILYIFVSMKKILSLIILIYFIVSCSTVAKTVQIPVETVKTEYIYNIKYDSIYIRDSIDRWYKGDTIYIYKEHTKYKYINHTDTIIKIDTVPKIITITQEKVVEVNHIYWWQKLLMWLGGISLMIIILYIVYKMKK